MWRRLRRGGSPEMATPALITPEQITRAFADALATVCAHRLGDTAIVQPASPVSGPGWLATISASGVVSGEITAWFDRQSAAALSRRILKREGDPDDQAVASLLRDVVANVNASIETTSAAAGVMLGDPSIAAADHRGTGSIYQIAFSSGLKCQVAVA